MSTSTDTLERLARDLRTDFSSRGIMTLTAGQARTAAALLLEEAAEHEAAGRVAWRAMLEDVPGDVDRLRGRYLDARAAACAREYAAWWLEDEEVAD